MALTATVYHLQVGLSDVDRAVYQELDLRLARHPSETLRYLLTRLLAYCLSYEDGIAFSKGGLSSSDEPPIAVRDLTGLFLAWIDVGTPSADRLHKATKAARRVVLYTEAAHAQLLREARTRTIHKVEQIEVLRIEPAFITALEAKVGRNTKLEILRNDGQLYVTVDGETLSGELVRCSLGEE